MSDIRIVNEAIKILRIFELGHDQINDRSAITLLALLQLGENDNWEDAMNLLLGTRVIMDWIRDEYCVDYKSNSCEMISRFTLHQFMLARIVE